MELKNVNLWQTKTTSSDTLETTDQIMVAKQIALQQEQMN